MAFSDNIETIRGFAANAAQTAASTTKKLAAIAKANINILAEEEKVKKAQLELGKVYYKNFISGEDTDLAECLPLCEKITASLKLIDELKAQIAQARNGAPEEDEPAADDFNVEEVVEKVLASEPEAPETAEEAPAAPVVPEIIVVDDDPAAEAPAE